MPNIGVNFYVKPGVTSRITLGLKGDKAIIIDGTNFHEAQRKVEGRRAFAASRSNDRLCIAI